MHTNYYFKHHHLNQKHHESYDLSAKVTTLSNNNQSLQKEIHVLTINILQKLNKEFDLKLKIPTNSTLTEHLVTPKLYTNKEIISYIEEQYLTQSEYLAEYAITALQTRNGSMAKHFSKKYAKKLYEIIEISTTLDDIDELKSEAFMDVTLRGFTKMQNTLAAFYQKALSILTYSKNAASEINAQKVLSMDHLDEDIANIYLGELDGMLLGELENSNYYAE